MEGSLHPDRNFQERLLHVIEANLTNPQFGVSELAREMGMSRSNLHLKVKKITHQSVSQFINHVRLNKAFQLLKDKSVTVSEAAFESGFHSVSYFTKCFHDYFGYPPGEIRKQDGVTNTHELPASTDSGKFLKVIITSILILALIIPVIAFTVNFIAYRMSRSKGVIMENTIAVLPFKNNSQDSTNTYFINGLMENIINNLTETPDLTVRSRTSVEMYRNTLKTIPEIAKELNVNYIVEGSGQKYGELIVLNIQLLEANSDHLLFSKQYRKEVKEVRDFTELQNEIAYNLASEIKNMIEPHDIQWYREISTENFEALKLYLQGLEKYRVTTGSRDRFKMIDNLIQAREYFKKSIRVDSTFILPMIELGWVYNSLQSHLPVSNEFDRLSDEDRINAYFNRTLLDSAYYFANLALKFDNSNTGSYILAGYLNAEMGNFDAALKNYEEALKYANNTQAPYLSLGSVYYAIGNYSKGVEFCLKQLAFERENNLTIQDKTVYTLYHQLGRLGFIDESNKYSEWLLKLNHDTAAFVERSMYNYLWMEKYDSAIATNKEYYQKDSTALFHYLPWSYLLKRDYKEAITWFHTYNRVLQNKGIPPEGDYGLAFCNYFLGNEETALPYFLLFLDFFQHQVEQNYWPENSIPHIHIASIYSTLNYKEKALEALRKNKSCHIEVLVTLKSCPRFDNIRNEKEFQLVYRELENCFQQHQEKVGRLLTELVEN